LGETEKFQFVPSLLMRSHHTRDSLTCSPFGDELNEVAEFHRFTPILCGVPPLEVAV
jgi:hypothetical protein